MKSSTLCEEVKENCMLGIIKREIEHENASNILPSYKLRNLKKENCQANEVYKTAIKMIVGLKQLLCEERSQHFGLFWPFDAWPIGLR